MGLKKAGIVKTKARIKIKLAILSLLLKPKWFILNVVSKGGTKEMAN